MTDIDPRARSPKSRSRLTEQEKEAERDRDRDRASGAIVDIAGRSEFRFGRGVVAHGERDR